MMDLQTLVTLISNESNSSKNVLSELNQQLGQRPASTLMSLLTQVQLTQSEKAMWLQKVINVGVQVTNATLARNLLSFNAKEIANTPVTLQLITDMQVNTQQALLKLDHSFDKLTLTLPKHTLKIDQSQLLSLLQASLKQQPNIKNQFEAYTVKQAERFIAKAQHINFSVDLPKSLSRLISDNQPALISLSNKGDQFMVSVRLDKQSQPIVSTKLPTKQVVALINQQNSITKLLSAEQPKVLVHNKPVELNLSLPFNINKPVAVKLDTLGTGAILKVPENKLIFPFNNVALNASDETTLLTQAKPTTKSLSNIQSFIPKVHNLNSDILKPILVSLSHYLNKTKNTPDIQKINAGQVTHKLIANIVDKIHGFMTNDRPSHQVLTTQAVNKPSQESMLIYQRPVLTHFQNQSVDNDVKERKTTNLVQNAQAAILASNDSKKATHQNQVNPFNALHKLINANMLTLPDNLDEMVNQAFTKIISQHSDFNAVNLQLRAVLGSANLNTTDVLKTPLGHIQHAAIALAANGLAQQQSLPQTLQSKLENLLPLLFNLTKSHSSEAKNTKKPLQHQLPLAMQTRLSEQFGLIQKTLSASTQSSSATAANTEQTPGPICFQVPQQQDSQTTNIPITIEQEQKQSRKGQTQTIWKINLVFNIDGQPLNIAAELNKKDVALNYAASHPLLLNKVKDEHHLLIDKLQSHGINITQQTFQLEAHSNNKTNQSSIINLRI